MKFTRAHFDSIGMVHLRMPDGIERTAWPIDAREFIAGGAMLLYPPKTAKAPAHSGQPDAPVSVRLDDEAIDSILSQSE